MLLSFKNRYATIRVWEPRYHDRKVLIATRKVAARNKVIIEKGAYAGTYFLPGVVATACYEGSNGKIPCYEVPLSLLERIMNYQRKYREDRR